MKEFLIIACILAVVPPIAATAQELDAAEKLVKTAVDNCMSRVANGKADDAFSILFSEYWNVRSRAPQAASTMQRRYREIADGLEDTMGKPVPGGYEFIGVKRLGTSVLRFLYLQKNELYFLPWSFSFYRSGEAWKLTRISFPEVGSEDFQDFVVTELATPRTRSDPPIRSRR